MTTETAKGKIYQFESSSAADTIRCGHEIARLLKPPKLMILHGDLGAGKTTLVKGIAEALDAAEPDEVTSPTFTLIHEYEGKFGGKPVKLYHLDLYRVDTERQLDTLGLDELIGPDSIILVEWGDKFPWVAKRSQGEIMMCTAGGDTRKITLSLKD